MDKKEFEKNVREAIKMVQSLTLEGGLYRIREAIEDLATYTDKPYYAVLITEIQNDFNSLETIKFNNAPNRKEPFERAKLKIILDFEDCLKNFNEDTEE